MITAVLIGEPNKDEDTTAHLSAANRSLVIPREKCCNQRTVGWHLHQETGITIRKKPRSGIEQLLTNYFHSRIPEREDEPLTACDIRAVLK